MSNTETDIEKEVQARVDFKINELLTGLRNQATMEWHIAFQTGNPKHSHYWEAFEQMVKMVEKERAMPTPYTHMALEKKREARDKAVEGIIDSLDLRGKREYHHIVRNVVKNIEQAQNF